MYLLDTNHCSFIFVQRYAEVVKRFRSLIDTETEVAINSIVHSELVYLVQKSQRKEENQALLNTFLQKIKIYSVDEETSKIYGRFRTEIFNKFAPKDKTERRKFKVEEAGVRPHDLWIACTAIQHDLILVSQDRDFQVMNQVRKLKLECWKTR
ncbi:MAG TPA: type II toxin-antitoxin system VapC family toxin [Thermosynechococcaceae cyanobacterium]